MFQELFWPKSVVVSLCEIVQMQRSLWDPRDVNYHKNKLQQKLFSCLFSSGTCPYARRFLPLPYEAKSEQKVLPLLFIEEVCTSRARTRTSGKPSRASKLWMSRARTSNESSWLGSWLFIDIIINYKCFCSCFYSTFKNNLFKIIHVRRVGLSLRLR